MIKSFTDINQSKKLAEILPLESADMWYNISMTDKFGIGGYEDMPSFLKISDIDIPSWSFSALFDVLPEIDGSPLNIERVKAEDGYDGYYYHIEYKDKILIPYSKNPIDACVDMIIKLNELNLL